MPNQNPIQVDSPFLETVFEIPKKYSNTMIYVTIKIELAKEGWIFASAHSVFLSGINKYPEKTPEPSDLKLNYAGLLNGERLAITSHISRIHEESEDAGAVPVVKYTLLLEAGDTVLNVFEAESGTDNPTDFKSLLIFKIEQ